MTTDQLKDAIAKALHNRPRHIIVPVAVLGAIVVLAGLHVAITDHGRSQNRATVAAVAQVANRTPAAKPAPSAKPTVVAQIEAPAASPTVAQIEPVETARPAQAISASPASGASTVATATPVAVMPPAGIVAGTVDEAIESRDQFNQWLKLSHRTIELASLNLATPPAPQGFTGTRRVVYTGWIKTASPTSTVALHAVGASATVAAEIDGTWSLDAEHSNAWVSAPTVTQSVIALAPGWHRVAIAVTTSSSDPTAVELQLGVGDVDPTVPVPYSVPSAGGAK